MVFEVSVFSILTYYFGILGTGWIIFEVKAISYICGIYLCREHNLWLIYHKLRLYLHKHAPKIYFDF